MRFGLIVYSWMFVGVLILCFGVKMLVCGV